jgi:cell division protein FtsL
MNHAPRILKQKHRTAGTVPVVLLFVTLFVAFVLIFRLHWHERYTTMNYVVSAMGTCVFLHEPCAKPPEPTIIRV